MKIGYEGDKKTCGQLLELVLKMIKDYKKVGRIGELELFLKQMKQTLELTLEK